VVSEPAVVAQLAAVPSLAEVAASLEELVASRAEAVASQQAAQAALVLDSDDRLMFVVRQ